MYSATSPTAIGLDEMPLLENAHRAKDLAEDARDSRLARARVAGEHHVQADVGVRQPRLAAPPLQLQVIRERADFVLDRVEANQRIQFRQRFIQLSSQAFQPDAVRPHRQCWNSLPLSLGRVTA